MKWSDLLASMPQKPTEHREELILQQVFDGNFLPVRWAAVSSQHGGYLGILYVSSDALQLGEPGDSCRANFSHRGAQRAVDHLGLALPTTKIADLVHHQASTVVPPQVDGGAVKDGTMAHTAAMIRHSRRVSLLLGEQNGLVSTVGKHWVTHDKLRAKPRWGVNYGWHYEHAPYTNQSGQHLWQPVGAAHNWSHVDYSQVLVPVNRVMLVNGEEMLLEDVMQHPDLCHLVSHDGPMAVTRHPDVAPPAGGVPVLRI